MLLVECFDQKQKLKLYLNNLKCQIYQNLENSLSKNNIKCFNEI